MSQLDGIDDPDVKRAFCENVPANRELLAAWGSVSRSPSAASFE
jgi:hypothetical protein